MGIQERHLNRRVLVGMLAFACFSLFQEAQTKTLELSPEELALAKTLDYDTKVLFKIKQALNPQMGIVKIGGLETPDRSFLQDHGASKTNQASIEAVALAIETASVAKMPPEKGKRILRMSAVLKEYGPLMRQEAKDLLGHTRGKVFLDVPADSPIFDSDEATDKYIADFRASYKGKTLRPENKSKAVLALKFSKPGDQIDSMLNGIDPRITELNKEIESAGYKLIPERDILIIRDFENENEALNFLQDEGKIPGKVNFSLGKSGYRAISFRKVALLNKIGQDKINQ